MSSSRMGVTGAGMGCVISTFSTNHNGFWLSDRRRQTRQTADPDYCCLNKNYCYMCDHYIFRTAFGRYGEGAFHMLPFPPWGALSLFFCGLALSHKSMKERGSQIPNSNCVWYWLLSLWGPVISMSIWLHRLGTRWFCSSVFAEPI